MIKSPRSTELALKSATDEWLDAWVNRPLAALVVRMVVRTPVTPNQMTLVCMLTGLAAGWALSKGPGWTIALGAALTFATMVLDCCDGQLARARGGGSTLGRILDGYGDAVVAVALHLGVFLYLDRQDVQLLGATLTSTQKLALVAAAGFSMQIHCALFDFYKHRFLSYTGQDRRGVETPDFYRREMEQADGWFAKALIAPFVLYQLGQEFFVPAGDRASRPVQIELTSAQQEDYAARHAPLVRAWSLIGPTFHTALIMACAVATLWNRQAFLLYVFASIVLMNVYMLTLLVWQRLANRSATVHASAADAE